MVQNIRQLQNNSLLFDIVIVINFNTACAFIHTSFSLFGVALHPVTGHKFLSPKCELSQIAVCPCQLIFVDFITSINPLAPEFPFKF